jgi:proteasome lid subunit RPN8/RPN11
MRLAFSREHLAALNTHAEREYPREGCGILLGSAGETQFTVTEVLPCTNEIAARHDRYRIPPSELIAAQKRARAGGMDIIGFYHSHPDHPPQWSQTDLAEAHWFGCVYVIIGVERGVVGKTRAFLLEGDEQQKQFSELELYFHP